MRPSICIPPGSGSLEGGGGLRPTWHRSLMQFHNRMLFCILRNGRSPCFKIDVYHVSVYSRLMGLRIRPVIPII